MTTTATYRGAKRIGAAGLASPGEVLIDREPAVGDPVALTLAAFALAPTYIVYRDPQNASTYLARRGLGGSIDYEGRDFATVLNAALANVYAINARGGIVLVPASQYNPSTDILVPGASLNGSNQVIGQVSLVGERGGRYATEFYVQASVPLSAAAIVIGNVVAGAHTQANAVSGVLASIQVTFGGGNGTVDGVLCQGSDVRLDGLRITSAPRHGIHYSSGDGTTQYDVHSFDCYVLSAGADGYHTEGTMGDSEWLQCKSKSAGGYGFYNNSNNCHYLHCHPFAGSSDGYRLDGAGGKSLGVAIIGGESESNTGTGIYVSGAVQANVSKVRMYGNSGAADIWMTNALQCGIEACDLGSSTGRGIAVASGCSYNRLLGNGCHGANSYGISLEGGSSSSATQNVVANNTIDNAATYGIRVQDAQHNSLSGNVSNKAIQEVNSAGASDYNTFGLNNTNGQGVNTVGTHSVATGLGNL